LSIIISYLEGENSSVIDVSTANVLNQFGIQHIEDTWKKALNRISEDPAGALTSTKTLVESIYKSLLEQLEIDYGQQESLPSLHKKVSELLNFIPELHNDKRIKTITGNFQSIVQELGGIRNDRSDAHSPKPDNEAPSVELARFVVTVTGAIATFIICTYEAQKSL
jgi:hypothetical protein